MAKTKQLYEDNGVELSKGSISAGDEVTLVYSGLLAKNGADMVYAHIGYGEDWQEKDYLPMQREEGIFKTTIKVSSYDSLNIAFKDGGDNWDNNSQANYSFRVAKKASRSVSSTSKVAYSEEKKTTSKSDSIEVSSIKVRSKNGREKDFKKEYYKKIGF